jgi:transposase-like protein
VARPGTARQQAGQDELGENSNPKTAVTGMFDLDAREVRVKVIPNVRRATLQAEILKQVTPAGTVYTDQHMGYDLLSLDGFLHQFVNCTKEHVRGQVHAQRV